MDYNILECLDCKETYLADNFSDGYNCPKCAGYTRPIGNIEEMEKQIKQMVIEISKAKRNGLIRNYFKHPNPLSPKLALKPEGPPINYIGGVDLAGGKDHTITSTTNNPYIDRDKFIKDLAEELYNYSNDSFKRSGPID